MKKSIFILGFLIIFVHSIWGDTNISPNLLIPKYLCTGKDLINSIHFCDRCKDSLHFHWFGSAMGEPPNPSVLGERQRKAFDAWYNDQALAERRRIK